MNRTLDELLHSAPRHGRRLLIAIVSNASEKRALERWAQCQARRGRLVVLGAGSPNTGRGVARRADHAHRVAARLGAERGSFYTRLPADARASDIAALIGTLRSGHAALIALPRQAMRRSVLIRRLVNAGETPADARPDGDLRALRFERGRLVSRVKPARPPARCPTGPFALSARPYGLPRLPGAANRDIAMLHERASQRLQVDDRACVLLIGARGTGKSTRLARLHPVMQALEPDGIPPQVVSGGLRERTVLSARLPDVKIEAWQTLLLPPERMSRAASRSVLIDEAASLPLKVLEAILARYDRVVMASTVDGYEASGRAFRNRFLDRLDDLRPDALVLRTTERWRFGDDAVHRAMRRAFMLDALENTDYGTGQGTGHGAGQGTTHDAGMRAPAVAARRAQSCSPIRIERVERALEGSERLARQAIALLGATHYRTALDELDPLLDGRLGVWLARSANDEVVGLATLASEGGLPAGLHDAVLAGRRRLPDQLLPQLLCRCAGDASALGEHYARVTRISVAPAWRRRGIATRLIGAIRVQLPEPIALGASFGDAIGAQRFWAAAGLHVFHHGQRVNPRSGQRSVAVLLGGSSVTRRVLARARAVLLDNTGQREDASRDAELIARFARGERALMETRAPLGRAWRRWTGDAHASLDDAGPRLGLPEGAGGRRLQQALATWARALN